MITILSNGSKWAGEQPDSIEKLLEVLTNHPLDRSFESYGNFIEQGSVSTSFFGNFFNLSHVFRIETDEAQIIAALSQAIRTNQQRPDYLSQHKPARKLPRNRRLEAAAA